jgi:TRAP-type C4-dicarboxylate transport system permease small subunit
MSRVKHTVDRLLELALIVVMAAMTLNVLWQVFTRFVLNDPSSFTDELARYLLIWVGVLGASYGVSKRFHLAIDLLPRKLEGVKKARLEIFIECWILAFAAAVMVIGGSQLVSITLQLEQTSAALQVPLGYVYIVIPVSGILIVFYSTLFILKRMGDLKRDASPGDESADQGATALN